ncbi:hypothetical protein ACMGDH_16730 [Sphingomonas sp. DT-207]|uniref:hypothetical protein n=1 Tax=Sphingomonas sp. DT-207 TaxID=3396167 RepID=UPI003F1DB227
MREDSDYYRGRAEAEIAAAHKAEKPEAMRAHYILAGYYLDRAHGSSPREVEVPHGI